MMSALGLPVNQVVRMEEPAKEPWGGPERVRSPMHHAPNVATPQNASQTWGLHRTQESGGTTFQAGPRAGPLRSFETHRTLFRVEQST